MSAGGKLACICIVMLALIWAAVIVVMRALVVAMMPVLMWVDKFK